MNLIQLQCFNNSAPNKLLESFYINADFIVSICKDPNSQYTEITTYGDEIYYVKESPEDVIAIINKDKIIKPKAKKESPVKGKSKLHPEVASSLDPEGKMISSNTCGPINRMSGDAKIASYKPTLKRVKKTRFSKKFRPFNNQNPRDWPVGSSNF